jgi:hypothetical protein
MSKKGDIGFRYIIALLLGVLTLIAILAFYGGLGKPAQELMRNAFSFHFLW